MTQLDQEQRDFILQSAILSPSADNHHRIRFQVDGDTIHIRYTEKLLPYGGYKRVLALLSLGAVVENLSIAASRFSLDAQTTLLPDPTRPGLSIQICLHPTQAAIDPLWQSIPLRHTNRQVRFRGPKLTNIERSELTTAISAYPSSQLIWLDDPAQRKQALWLMRRAETERYRNQILHEEFFSAIRFDVGWHATCAEGLPPGALGVEPPLRPLFKVLRHWSAMRWANLFGADHIFGFRVCDLPCRLAPHLGLLSVTNTDNQSVFDTGRAFQRLWLALTKQGRVLQPMPASVLYALEGVQTENISVKLQKSLAQGWKSSLGTHIPLMLFRIGFATPGAIMAGRPQLKSFLDASPANMR
jgi:hypothetical protein